MCRALLKLHFKPKGLSQIEEVILEANLLYVGFELVFIFPFYMHVAGGESSFSAAAVDP